MLALPDGEPAALELTARVAERRAAAVRVLAQMAQRITDACTGLRADAVGQLRQRWAELKEEASARLQPHYTAVETAAAALEAELRKAGKLPREA